MDATEIEQMIANGMDFVPQYASSREVETNEAIPV